MSKNKTKFLFLVFLSCSSFTMYAQFGMGKIEEIEAAISRKVIVMIEEPRERILKRIAKNPKRGSTEDYKADLKKYNENIKAVIEKFWPYNKDGIQYKTFKEIQALKESKSKEYTVIFCLSTKPNVYSSGYKYAEGLYWVKDIKDDFEDRDDDMFSSFMINTIEDWGTRPIYSVPLFDVFPTKASLVYGLKNIESYFNMRIQTKKNGAKPKDERERMEEEMKAKAPKLAEKILLIREEWLDKELTADNLKKYYPYKYKICDREFMDNVVMTQDANYAYGVELPYILSTSHSNVIIHYQFVMDGEDSMPMCVVKPGNGGVMLANGITGKAGTRNFTIKTMTKIVEQVKGETKAKTK